MREYHKISAVFQRSKDGAKKLIEGEYTSSAIEFLENNTWVGTEKIDGTNIRVYWDGHSVSFAGRTDNAVIPKHLQNKLEELFCGEDTEQVLEQMFGDKKVILFGEGYGEKIQNGGLYRSDVSFILFDVLMLDSDLFLRYDDVVDVARMLNIEVVPIVVRGTMRDIVEFVKSHPKSTIGNAPMEGVVCKPEVELYDRLGNRIITKVKVRDFAMGGEKKC